MERPFDPVAALVAYHAALERRDFAYVNAALAENAVYESKGLGAVSGKAAILSALQTYFTHHPDHKAWDTNVVEEAPRMAKSHWQLQATEHITGKKITRSGTERVTFDAKGRIVSVAVEDLT